jgi:hypothetical protein
MLRLKYYLILSLLVQLFAYNSSNPQNVNYSQMRANTDLLQNPYIENSIEFKHYGSVNDEVWEGEYGITESVDEIMLREEAIIQTHSILKESKIEFKSPRRNLPPTSGLDVSQWPPLEINSLPLMLMNPQTIGTNFLGSQLSESGFIPPDCIGDVGPTQILVAANGRLKVFSKSGTIGPLNSSTDNFFNSVRNGSGTSDPHIRYDRLSQRWFIVIINLANRNNRVLIAVSSGSIITSNSSFTFYFFQQNLVSPTGDNNRFADYPTLGVDANALYIGTNNFTIAGSFTSLTGFVVRKTSLTGGGPIVVSAFRNLSLFTPQGVDNDDPAATVGYFIGVNVSVFNQIDILMISDPGGTPSISGTFNITVPTTRFPEDVPALGTSTKLDALDDRLFAAHIRKNKLTGVQSLWTAHNIEVNSSGVGSTTGNRTASRWYEFRNIYTTPTLNQAGTLFDPAVSNPQFFWIPSVAMNGQGHMALSCSRAGVGRRAEIVLAGRLSSDPLGSTQTFTLGQSSSTAYDITVTNPQRWGDYSQTVVDPTDDMTMWTFQEYCNATDSWAVRVIELLAPPPVTPTTASPSALTPNQSGVDVVITGTSLSGSGFFDPGPDIGGPGFPNHISASITGGIVVNSITFNSTTQFTLNINTTSVSDGFYDVTVTNPDGQNAVGVGILQIDSAVPVELVEFAANILNGNKVLLEWRTATEVNNYGFEVERQVSSLQSTEGNWDFLDFVEGHGNSNSLKEYEFIDENVLSGKYSYRLKQIDNDGTFEYSKVIEVDMNAPVGYELSQNYPNPFNPETTIKFTIAEAGFVKLSLYNILGELKGTIVNEFKEAGIHTINFKASELNSGIYLYKLEVDDFVEMRKMSLIK